MKTDDSCGPHRQRLLMFPFLLYQSPVAVGDTGILTVAVLSFLEKSAGTELLNFIQFFVTFHKMLNASLFLGVLMQQKE
jgi:hypothetical protein